MARDVNVRHKPKPIIPESQRLRMIQSLKSVDSAVLGEEKDIFRTIEELRPDIITLGFDQHFDPALLEAELSSRGLYPKIVRIEDHEPCPLCSSRQIVARILGRFRGRRI
ncbi:FAD synthase [uncultured archaeon]|nr:FAD synthase [uncultured archaeon]